MKDSLKVGTVVTSAGGKKYMVTGQFRKPKAGDHWLAPNTRLDILNVPVTVCDYNLNSAFGLRVIVEPVPEPPKTYTLTVNGLTEKDLQMIKVWRGGGGASGKAADAVINKQYVEDSDCPEGKPC